MTIFYQLNPIVQAMSMVSNDGHGGPVVEIEDDNTNIFGVGASMEEFSHVLITRELSLFQRLSIPLLDGESTKNNFQMLASLPNIFLGLLGLKLK
jgi:hypothetical protein